ncbi:PREDICTED: putative pectinesterase 10 [Camelina sativa]|uniref:pectinesterase n=1 Tax=Camelina sativa TaxID=90675 RepID=A0ABM0ZNY4_CAMSA|nr:PREDICTED: putative pectinesterase 10 [Camelina sativa]
MKGMALHSLCYSSYYKVCLMAMLLSMYGSTAWGEYSIQINSTISVNPNGAGNFTTIQSAIDSIPLYNQNWILILIENGTYNEKVKIPYNKGYVYLQGRGIEKTIIAYNDHQFTDTSSTFTAFPDNIIITGITFRNTYNIESIDTPIKPAVAARLLGDKYVVLDSSFDGFQDTLYDCLGRHYYKRCVITGGIDFIFGYARSLYEGCTLNMTVGIYAPDRAYGTITAQGNQLPTDEGGFVFNDCTVTGNGKALLGRAWEPYARVIFYRSELSDVILPIGWDAWKAKDQEGHTTFVEYGCIGAGANTSERVPWLKKESEEYVLNLTSRSFINQDGWLDRLPMKF